MSKKGSVAVDLSDLNTMQSTLEAAGEVFEHRQLYGKGELIPVLVWQDGRFVEKNLPESEAYELIAQSMARYAF